MSHMVEREQGYYGHPEHVHRPVYIDENGIKEPIISYSTTTTNHHNGGYITQKETIIERLYAPTPMVHEYGHRHPLHLPPPTKTDHTPMTNEYMHMSPRKVNHYQDYGSNDHKWHQPTSPVNDRPQQVNETITEVQTQVIQPTKTTPYGDTYLGHPINPLHGYGRNTQGNMTYPIGKSRPIARATNDVGEAVGFLKEALAKETYVQTIDNRGATRGYARPEIKTRDQSYAGTIYNSDASRKYGATYIPS